MTAPPPKLRRSIVRESEVDRAASEHNQRPASCDYRRIERLEEEKAALASDLREVYAEAKGNGFDVKALRAVICIRKQDENKRREEVAVLDTYLHALGIAKAEAA